MKTLHLDSGKNLYGGPLQVMGLLRGLRARGEEAVLVCRRGSALADAARGQAARVHPIPMESGLGLGLLGRLRALIRAERPDLVHVHSRRRGADLWGGLAARLEGVPAVLSRRVDDPEPAWSRPRYRLYRRVIAISEGIRKVLLAQGVAPDRAVCVHSAVDTERYHPGGDRAWLRREFDLPEASPVLAMAGQFIARKGHRTLLAALPAVFAAHPEARVLLLGQGPLLEPMREAAADAGLADRVRFAGFRDDLDHVLAAVDLLVHPAELEGLGVSLLQAAACGVPIVATRTGGIPEAVRPGLNGELVEPGDAPALAAQIVRLLDDPALRTRYGAAGRELVLRHFSLDAMVEGNLAVYRAVLAAQRGGAPSRTA
jgi:glycosyltransferase involved in cell wall biosynthesis